MNDVEGALAYLPTNYEPVMPPRSRTTPSGAVDWAWEELKQHPNFRLKKALDIGCGRGRNSLFLARKGFHVTAMDFAPNAISALQESADRQKLTDKIRPLVYDIGEYWPIAPHTMDLVVDAFCFKHLDYTNEYQTYKDNLLRVLSAHGHYLLSFTSIGDGLYGHYIRKRGQEEMPKDDAVKIDPINGIESTIYTREKAIRFFGPELTVYAELKNKHACPSAFEPETYALLFKRSESLFHV